MLHLDRKSTNVHNIEKYSDLERMTEVLGGSRTGDEGRDAFGNDYRAVA